MDRIRTPRPRGQSWSLFLISATGSLANALPILHFISFGLAALTVAATYRLIAHSAPGVVAVVGALAVLAFPPMIVQTAEIYLDLPLACLGTWSLVLLLERRFMAASMLTTLAVWVKPIGSHIRCGRLAYSSLLTTFATAKSCSGRFSSRLLRLAMAAVISVLQSSKSSAPPLVDRYVISVGGSSQLLQTMPDLIVILLVTLSGHPRVHQREPKERNLYSHEPLIDLRCCICSLEPRGSNGIPLLPRYYIAILPVVIAALLTACDGEVASNCDRYRVISRNRLC